VIGAHPAVVFDEAHLGIQRHPGTMFLVRKYGMEQLVVGLALLAALLIWRNAAGFVPRYEDELPYDPAQWETGRDAHAGLVNLMRRTVPPRKLPTVCVAEWKKSVAPALRGGAHSELVHRMESLVQSETVTEPKELYEALTKLIAERKLSSNHGK